MAMNRSMLAGVFPGFVLAAGPLPAADVAKAPASTEVLDAVLPPDLDRVLRNYECAWRAGDALAVLFVEDGFALQSNRSPMRGRAAVQAAYESQSGAPLQLSKFAFSAGDMISYIISAYGHDDGSDDTKSSR